MQRTCLLIIIIFCFLQKVSAQPSKAEIDKMMKQAQEQIKVMSKDTNFKQALKGVEEKQQQVMNAMKKDTGTKSATDYDNTMYDAGSYGNVDNWKFPPKNTALLASFPKKVLTKAELIDFLGATYIQLSKKFPAGVSSSVQVMTAKYNNDGNKMGDAAVMGWYKNYRQEALLLILKAAINNPDNGVLLNNCAAMLNMAGIEQKAIPVLKYVLQAYPDNSMVLNNLGQSYAGLGETDTAMRYLSRCIKIEPEHPEACNTAGQIEAIKGNKEKAAAYFEKALKTAYSKTAELKLRKIKKDSKIVPLVRPRVKIPEYFNHFKYKLPQQCTSVETAVVADAEHNAFRETITKELYKYGKEISVLQQAKYAESIAIMNAGGKGRIVHKNEFIAHNFYELCGIMQRDINTEFMQELANLTTRVDKQYMEAGKILYTEYKGKLDVINKAFAAREETCCGEGKTNSCCPTTEEKCKARNALANQYLPLFAALTTDWQEKNKLVFTTYFDELMYWGYLTYSPTGMDNFKLLVFYPLVSKYLVMLGKIGITRIIEPCEFKPVTATMESITLREYDCPVDVEISFAVGSFEISCDKISFSGGEGAVFSYEKNFKTKKSTLAIGIGVQLELGQKAGPVKVKAAAGVTETLFITFDGNNQVEDYGLKMEAKAEAGIGASKGETVKVKKEIAKESVNVGYTFGINSGVNFNEGPFKGMVN